MSAQTLQIIGYFLAGWIFGGLSLAAAHLARGRRSPVRVRATSARASKQRQRDRA